MKYILELLKPQNKRLMILSLFYALQTISALFMPYVMSNIVEYGIRLQDIDYIWWQSAVMVALALVSFGSALITNKFVSKFSTEFSTDLRRKLLNKVNQLSTEEFNKIGTGSLLTRVTSDIGWMEDTIGSLAYVLVSEPIMLIGGIVLSLLGDWLLALILLGVSIIVLAIVAGIALSLEKLWKRGDEFADAQNRIVRERLSGIRVIRAFDKESYEQKRVEYATTEMSKAFVRSNTTSGIINPLATFVLNLATVAVIYIGAVRLQIVETLVAGDIIATIQYIALIINAILTLTWVIVFIPHIRVISGRLNEVLDRPVDETDVPSGEKLDGSIEFKGVNFAYQGSDKNALSDINLEIKPGEIVGVIGGTGSGKSTLVKLIMNLYPSAGGERTMGGKDYNSVTPSTIRDNISIALQKSMIFGGTIEENVKMGNKDATSEQVEKALEISQLKKFVDSHDEGLNYVLNQQGTNISGGQKQRVNIARAILKDASVYIFDDSFSALDYLTETKLRKALNKYLAGKTQIIITQRAATAMRCDKVYCLDNGKVVGCGTHKELLDSCQIYKEIYNSQLGGGKLE